MPKPPFDLHQYHMRQRVLSVSERYEFGGESGPALVYAIRPAQVFRRFLAICCGIVAGLSVGVLVGHLVSKLTTVILAVGLSGFVVGVVVLLLVILAVENKRHVYFSLDAGNHSVEFKVLQNEKMPIVRISFNVLDHNGGQLARFSKNIYTAIIRKRWTIENPDGTLLAIAEEDSFILALLRRFIGPLFGLLRTNFVIRDGEGHILGEVNRKLTLRDHYLLDLTRDPDFRIDRRVGLALCSVLDTGENR